MLLLLFRLWHLTLHIASTHTHTTVCVYKETSNNEGHCYIFLPPPSAWEIVVSPPKSGAGRVSWHRKATIVPKTSKRRYRRRAARWKLFTMPSLNLLTVAPCRCLSSVTFSYAFMSCFAYWLGFVNFPSSLPSTPLSARDDSRSCTHVLIPCDFIYESLSLSLSNNSTRKNGTEQKPIHRNVFNVMYRSASFPNVMWTLSDGGDPCVTFCRHQKLPPRDGDTRFPNKKK